MQKKQSIENRWISNIHDKGHGKPLGCNLGYYSGVAEANFIFDHSNFFQFDFLLLTSSKLINLYNR